MPPPTAQADDKVRTLTPAREMPTCWRPQGTCINRVGRVFIRRDSATSTVWVGGETRFLIEGTLTL